MDPSAIIAATAANLGVSDVLRWPADDQVTEFGAVELHAIGVTYGGGHAVQRLADQYARVRADKRRQLRGDALREDWPTWVRGCAEKWSKRSEERRVGKDGSVRVDRGGRRIDQKKEQYNV